MANLQFITGIRFYKSALEQLNNVTFIYDPNWNINNSRTPTLPVCFFYVKSMHEVMSSEVSQKQMLFYNSDTKGTEAQADAGILNVVADNIVIKPKTYKLDLIIPYSDLTLLNQSFVYNANTLSFINATIFNKDTNFIAWSTLVNSSVKFWKDLIHTLMSVNHEDYTTKISNIISQPDFNKNSLELMWQMRRILKIKMWNSWTYKYVSIIDLDITKEGTENGVYEASMTVQEMPIVTLTKSDAVPPKFKYTNKLLELKGKAFLEALDGTLLSKALQENEVI